MGDMKQDKTTHWNLKKYIILVMPIVHEGRLQAVEGYPS